jgi:general secretion pathway protein L
MDLHSSINFDFSAFWRWWGRELAFLVPKRCRAWLAPFDGCLLMTPNAEGYQLAFYPSTNPNQWLWQTQLAVATPVTAEALLSQYPGLEKAERVLCLPAADTVLTPVFLPEAAAATLEQVLQFELDRLTPFTADQVEMASVLLGKTGYGQCQALLVAVPRQRLESYLQDLTVWGLLPHRVEAERVRQDSPHLLAATDLLPERYRPRASYGQRALKAALSLTVLALLVVVMVWPLWQQQQAVAFLKQHNKALEAPAQRVEQLQTTLDNLRAETEQLVALQRSQPDTLAMINALSALIPNDSWLTHLQYADKQLQIYGLSPSASGLIQALEASPYFSKVSLSAPLTQDKLSGRERFQISMEVNPYWADAVAGEAEHE